jgi:L-ascorbate metabolism protein UlaG (beta-lactamase superfamily)
VYSIIYIFCLFLFVGQASETSKFNLKKVKIITEDIEIEEFYDKKKKRFINPSGIVSKSFFDVLKWKTSTKPQIWPTEIPKEHNFKLFDNIQENQVSVTFINHSSFLLQFDSLNILTDPVFSKRVSPFSWVGPKRARKSGIEINQLPRIDIVIISHNHYDHLDIKSLKEINKKFKPIFIIPIGNSKLMTSNGISNFKELHWWQTAIFSDDLRVCFTPAQHFSNRGLFDKDKSLWGSYMITYKGQNVYFGGDTGYADHFKKIAKHFKNISLSFLPIGAYEPRWFMRDVHTNPEDAVIAHLDLLSKLSIGMHFGTFQLTDEGINDPIYDLKDAIKKHNISSNSFISLGVGETRIIDLIK